MSVSDQINRINTNIANAYTEAGKKGANLPATKNSANLSNTISSIPTGGGSSTIVPKTITQNGTYNASSDSADGFNPVVVNVPTGGGETEEWQPNPTWWDIESIIKSDTSGNRKKYIMLLSDSNATTTFTSANALSFKTSDGATYTGTSFNHTWDTSQDKQCVENGVNTYKTRWVMVYYNNSLADTTAITLGIADETIYMVIDTIKFTITNFGNKLILENFDLLNGSNLASSVTNLTSMFQNCYSLRTIPLLDTSNIGFMASTFGSCCSLRKIPLLNTNKLTSMSGTFSGCVALKNIPPLDLSNVTIMTSAFSSCNSLEELPSLNTNKVTAMNSMFSQCRNLKSIPLMDMSNVTNVGTMFANNYALTSINMQNLKLSLTLSTTAYGTLINRTSLLNIINGLADLTGQTAQTLTIGTTNLAKLTSSEKAIATNKNWTLA